MNDKFSNEFIYLPAGIKYQKDEKMPHVKKLEIIKCPTCGKDFKREKNSNRMCCSSKCYKKLTK